MAGKISVSGDVPLEGFEVLPAGRRGANVAIVGQDGDALEAARLAPASVLLLVDAEPSEVERVLAATLWPRGRVLGVKAADLPVAIRAVLGDGDAELQAVVLCRRPEEKVTEATVTVSVCGALQVGEPPV